LSISDKASAASNTQWQDGLATVLAVQGDAAGALNEFREGRAIVARLTEQSADNAKLVNHLAWLDADAKLESAHAPAPDVAPPDQAAGELVHPAQ
jgi:hypothetical protein